MRSLSCLVLDDEPRAVRLLESYIDKVTGLNLVAAGTMFSHVKTCLLENNIDLVFIDIQMPEISGIDIMKLFNESHNFIITTAYPNYALDSYSYNVIDYLLKPISFERFEQSIQKFKDWQQGLTSSKSLFFIKESGILYKIEFNDILYIEGLRDYIKIHTAGRQYMVLDSLKNILQQLPENHFARIHRSYIINIDRVQSVDSESVRVEDKELPLGDVYKKEFLLLLKQKRSG